jgi:hypothetical protein
MVAPSVTHLPNEKTASANDLHRNAARVGKLFLPTSIAMQYKSGMSHPPLDVDKRPDGAECPNSAADGAKRKKKQRILKWAMRV